jgi:hypothetical protein
LRFFEKKINAYIIAPMRATFPAHIILLYSIILLKFGEEYKL